MKQIPLMGALVLSLLAPLSQAQTNAAKLSFPVLITPSRNYTNATIDRTTPLEAIVYFDGGIARVAMSNMPPEVQRRYNYSLEAAQQFPEEQKAKAAAEKLKRQQADQALRTALQKAAHDALVTVDEDKFLKVTSFETFKIPLNGSISVYALCVTNKDVHSPNQIFLNFQSESESWRFLDYRRLIILYDGKTKDCGTIEHEGSVHSRSVLEQMHTQLSLEEFSKIADAKSVELRLGTREYSLSFKDREPLRALADRFRNNAPNSAPAVATGKSISTE